MIQEVLQQHIAYWTLTAHTGKHYKGWISLGNCGSMKGNYFLLLCGEVGRRSMVVMDYSDLCMSFWLSIEIKMSYGLSERIL